MTEKKHQISFYVQSDFFEDYRIQAKKEGFNTLTAWIINTLNNQLGKTIKKPAKLGALREKK